MQNHIEIGEEVKNFVVLEKLGEGGMGSVYKCLDKKLKRNVAIKFLSSDSIEDIKRFQKEAHLLAQLSHPNISIIYEVDYNEKYFYIVMEYLEGQNFQEFLKGHPNLTIKEYLGIFLQLSRALDYIHSKNIIHRDIKLSNLFVTSMNDVKIIDFGISKLSQGDTWELTRTNHVVGSPVYLAPETIGDGMVTIQSDIYSFGIAFINGILGYPIFEGGSVTDVIEKIKYEGVQLPDSLQKALPPILMEFMQYMIEFDPRDRYRNMQKVTVEIEAILNQLDENFGNLPLSELLNHVYKKKTNTAKRKQMQQRDQRDQRKQRQQSLVRSIFLSAIGAVFIFSILKWNEFNKKTAGEESHEKTAENIPSKDSEKLTYYALLEQVSEKKHPHVYEQLKILADKVSEAQKQGIDLPYMYNRYPLDLEKMIETKNYIKLFQKLVQSNAYMDKQLSKNTHIEGKMNNKRVRE